MDYIYLPCITRIKALAQMFIDNGVTPIAHFDRFKGQYLNPELHNAYPTPALFFKFNTTWETQMNNTQLGECTMEVHIELENIAESADGSPDQSSALQDFTYQTLVFASLQGFKTADFSALARISTDEDENPQETNITIMRFQCDIRDQSADRFRSYIDALIDDITLQQKPVDNSVPPVEQDDEYVI